jgi:hypothetical protein
MNLGNANMEKKVLVIQHSTFSITYLMRFLSRIFCHPQNDLSHGMSALTYLLGFARFLKR